MMHPCGARANARSPHSRSDGRDDAVGNGLMDVEPVLAVFEHCTLLVPDSTWRAAFTRQGRAGSIGATHAVTSYNCENVRRRRNEVEEGA